MNTNELRDLSADELRAKEIELREESFKLRFQHGTRQLDNTAGLKKVRREIASVLTLITEKEQTGA
jgi:large subunit ribosomal protein L29